VDFPVPDFYRILNEAEGLTAENGWNGSNLVGGSSRLHGSGLPWETIRDTLEACLERPQAARSSPMQAAHR
jgi:hypothetical protein